MGPLSCALLVVLAVVVAAYFSRRRRPAGPAFTVTAAQFHVADSGPSAPGDFIRLTVAGVPPPALAGCPVSLAVTEHQDEHARWLLGVVRDHPWVVATIAPLATPIAGGSADVYLRPTAGSPAGEFTVTGNPLGHLTIGECHPGAPR